MLDILFLYYFNSFFLPTMSRAMKKTGINYRNFIVFNASILAILILLFACDKKTGEKEVTSEESVKTEETTIDTLKLSETSQVDYGAMMETIFQLEDSIKQNPADIELRKALVAAAYDSIKGKLYTVGYGQPDTSITSTAHAMKTSERAALIDAQRWAMFIMRWQKNPDQPAISERVTGNVPPGTPVQKAILPVNNVYLLVEFYLRGLD